MIIKDFTKIKEFKHIKTTQRETVYTDFNGVDEKAYISDKSAFNYIHQTNKFTISVWVKLKTLPADSFYGILGSGGGTTANTGVSLWWDNRSAIPRSNTIAFFIGKSIIGQQVSVMTADSSDLDDTLWHHLVITSDHTTLTNKIYIDGVSQTLNLNSVFSLTTGDSTLNMDLGAINIYYGDMGLDEVSFYDEYKDATAVLDLYNRGRDNPYYGDISGLRSHYNMDTLDPADSVGGYDAVSIAQDASNIITEYYD